MPKQGKCQRCGEETRIFSVTHDGKEWACADCITDESDQQYKAEYALGKIGVDVDYAIMQVKHGVTIPCPVVEAKHIADCCQRALDALERVKEALEAAK